MLTLTRPLAVLDTETTGTDPVCDRIIEFGVTVYHPDGRLNTFEQRFNPDGVPISAGALEAHGITEEMLKDCPPFSEFAEKIHRGLQGKDIAGYNLRGLDLPLLDEELRRSGLKLDLSGVHIIDSASIFFNKEPRDLTAAYKFYCNKDLTDAHGAAADAAATLEVLLGQLERYNDLAAMDLAALAAFSRRGDKDYADLAGKLYRDSDGDLRYAFGQKTRDVKVRHDVGFAYWVLGKDFTGNTKEVLEAELARI